MSKLLLDKSQEEQLGSLESFSSFQMTWPIKMFFNCPNRIIGLFTGNQSMKTSSTAYNYVLRILGLHPVPKKNVVYFECENRHFYSPFTRPQDGTCIECTAPVQQHKRGSRKFRFASETLPGETQDPKGEKHEDTEVKNTQYPEFKKWLPLRLIKRDITFRNMAMVIYDPFGGEPIVVEFVSYKQTVQQGAGVQRMSVWMDEEPPFDFYREQLPRILAEDGDLIFSLTPANYITWTHDEIFEKAAVYYRSKYIQNFTGEPAVEHTGLSYNVAVVQAATDDNPTLSPEVIEDMYNHVEDPDELAIRRFGIFKQISGRIFKTYDDRVVAIPEETYFPDGIPYHFFHARFVDYHQHTPWACGWISISPQNEAFIHDEWNPSPEKLVTYDINRQMASMSKDFRYGINLIDPLAAQAQPNTGRSTLDDFNENFFSLRQEGIGTGGYWETWDTKSTRGRDGLRTRIQNSVRVGKPFNNEIVKDGRKIYIPTIWVFRKCRQTRLSLRNWRLEEWVDKRALVTKDKKDKPQQKWSHFCTGLEGIMKDTRFRAHTAASGYVPERRHTRFKGRR